MGLGQVWSRALVYFGIVEEDEYWDEEAYAAEEGATLVRVGSVLFGR
jgi:hypothetical protein